MVSVRNRQRYERYQRAFLPVLEHYGGKLVVADEQPQVREGRWPHQKLVIVEFADEQSFERCMMSDDYQEIARDRRAGADAIILVARGVTG
jgi:uncharacterized protein (DUF1330 family)